MRGTPAIEPEWLTAYEAGYLTVVAGALTVDLAASCNRCRSMMTGVGEIVPAVELDQGQPYFEIPVTYANLMSVDTAGGEAVAVHAPAADLGTDGGATPRHYGQLRYSVELPHDIDADVALFAPGAMPRPAYDAAAHARLDGRLAWRPTAPLELSVVMRNLTNADNAEHLDLATWSSGVVQPTYMRRSAHGSVTWTF